MATANGKVSQTTKHFPDDTTLGLPATPTFDRILQRAGELTELGTRFRGFLEWTPEDKQAIRDIVGATDRMWEMRRAELAALALEAEIGRSLVVQVAQGTREGMHYPKRRSRSGDGSGNDR